MGIIDEIECRGAAGVRKIAKHQYGCPILQRLLEHCRPDQVQGLVEDLLAEAWLLSKHIYGHFVMQHVIEHGTDSQRHHLISALEQHASLVGSDVHACAVVGTAMSLGTSEEQCSLASALLRQEGLVADMASTRHGSAVVKLLLKLLNGAEFDEACCQLSKETLSLNSSRFGRAVLALLTQCSGTGK